MVKRNEIIETVISDVEFPSKGVAIVDDHKIIIKDTLPGQKVKARIARKKGSKIEGRVIEILEKSPLEQRPQCQHFGECGGCSYQQLPYDEQLKMKANQVKRLLDNGGVLGFEFLGIEGSPVEWAYRNKMEFTFGDVERDGGLSLGMHKKGRFYEMVSVNGCQIVDQDFTSALELVLDYFRDKDIPFYHKKSHQGVLRHLVVRKAIKTGELLINLVTTSQMELDLSDLVLSIRSTPFEGALKGFLHTINDGLADAIQSDETRVLFGQDYITEEILGLKFKISAFSFFQTNSLGAEKLYSIVRDFAGPTNNQTLFDLYCGTGTIAQIMAPIAKNVIGIELVEEAVEAARANAELNGLQNCEFIAGDVLEKIDELGEKPDLIILDPPRSGVHPKAIHKIIGFDAPHIIYVSCKPTSLARDLKILQDGGYDIKKVKCMDMFPHTPHVETIADLYKRQG